MNTRKKVIVVLALFLMFFGFFIPLFAGLSRSQIQLLACFLGVLLLWLEVAIDWPSLLLIFCLSLIKELPFKLVLNASFGNQTFYFLLFTFILSYGLSKTNILKYLALSFLRLPLARKSPWHLAFIYFFSLIILGCFVSPTVLFFAYYPLLEEVFHLLKLEKGHPFASVLMMGSVIMCGISSGMTPISHVFPLIAMGFYEQHFKTTISYLSYLRLALPIGIICALFAFLYLYLFYRRSTKDLQLHSMKFEQLKLNKQDKFVLTIFIINVFLWVFAQPLAIMFKHQVVGDFFTYIYKTGVVLPPFLATIVLTTIKIDNKELFSLKEAFASGVNWPSLLMCAGALALSFALGNKEIGLSLYIRNLIALSLSHLPLLLLVFAFLFWAGIQTNFASNIVTSTLVASTFLSISSLRTDINSQNMIILIGMLASYSFATPPAMPCVAVATSSGYCQLKQMALCGLSVVFFAIILSTFIIYPLMQ